MIQPINQIIPTQPKNKPQKTTAYFSAPTAMLPTEQRNYCLFNQNKVDFIVSQKKHALPQLKKTLQTSNDEEEIVETLYIIDRMADDGVKGIPAMYPTLARFNDTKSPNIQVFLAGIYRKTQVPDAFGPLVAMLIKNSINKTNTIESTFPSSHLSPLSSHSFDPNEEIGGAILEYIKNYSQGPKPIDYNA